MTASPSAIAETKTASGRIFNFSAGPAVLPEPVLRRAQEDLWNIAGSGVGILEHSHRGKVFDRVMEETEANCRKIANIGDEHAVLFLQGGATLQFAMVPMNFLGRDEIADYPDTGEWTSKAIKEAKKFGRVNVAFEGSKTDYDHVPAVGELNLSGDAVYLHYCSNNTIYGTRYETPPQTSAPLVADTSSEMFSRPIDVNAHALIYAGAQKNLGPAGVTLVILRKDFMEQARPAPGTLPVMLDYRKQYEKGSRLNTPPTFGIYLMGEVFKWILDQGGLEALATRNEEKANLIYDAIDSSEFYTGVARTDARSRMNVTFRTPNAELDAKFVAEAKGQGMDGLKGHRSVGGLRASIYNAMPKEGCEALASFMRDFERRHG